VKDLYFVRHGQTEWNAIRRMQGQWNSDLTELGKRQADTNGRFLSQLGIEHIVASPLDRTRQTAEIINEHLGLEVSFDHRIKEWDCGDWSGEMWDQVANKWAEEFNAWQEDQFHYRGPNCENYPDMIERVAPFLEETLALDHQRIAVVSHGMIGRVMVGTLLAMTGDHMLSFSQPNDVIFHLASGGESFIAHHYVRGDGPHPGLPARNW
jgi:phosphoserine phosphatase